ncbi:hypothetical protein ACFW9F_29855 [Streptomyces sp. NPDC059506]|uniref:hypothetical protein n=1 Tax=Streptomyces sp. NPDC059506 TaxID=3347751 RepID=UPI0036D13A4B
MAKYGVARGCGHTEQVELTGPHARREQALARMAQEDCSACVQAQHQQQNAGSAAAAQAAGWPALAGTPRQVAWAETLRADAVAELRRDAAWWARQYPEATGDPVAAIEARTLAVTNASWWIDTRRNALESGVRLAATEVVRMLGKLSPLEGAAVGPHVIVQVVLDLPRPEPYTPARTVRVAVCSCGWQPTDYLAAMDEAAGHLAALTEAEQAQVRRAHPAGEPHACTEELGLRRCLMGPYLR